MHGRDKRIDRVLVDETLALHRKAYTLLMWLGETALEDPSVLSEEREAMLLDPLACAAWLAAERVSLPAELAPAPSQRAACAALLGSFLRTSFHITRFRWDGRLVDAKLVLAPGHEGARAQKRKRHGGEPRAEALHRLCRDEGLSIAHPHLAKLARAKALEPDVLLWTYVVGLVERARGGGEGASEWKLWRKLEGRRDIDAASVWAARTRLLTALGG